MSKCSSANPWVVVRSVRLLAFLAAVVMLSTSQVAFCYSFSGDDWLANMTGDTQLTGILLSDQPINIIADPQTVAQSGGGEISGSKHGAILRFHHEWGRNLCARGIDPVHTRSH